MFGIGFLEILVICIVGIVFVGPSRLPALARQMGAFFVQIRRVTNEVKGEIDQVLQKAEVDLALKRAEEIKERWKKMEEEETALVPDHIRNEPIQKNSLQTSSDQTFERSTDARQTSSLGAKDH